MVYKVFETDVTTLTNNALRVTKKVRHQKKRRKRKKRKIRRKEKNLKNLKAEIRPKVCKQSRKTNLKAEISKKD